MILDVPWLVFAVGTGVATFFSPCAYALLPGYVGYYVSATGSDRPPFSGILIRGVAATAGVFAAFGVVIAGTLLSGRSLEPVVPVFEAVVGVALVGIGVFVLVRGSLPVSVRLPQRRSTVVGFVLFGAAYAAAATACVFPVFFALVVRSLSMPPGQSVLVLGSFAGTFGVLMLSATTAAAFGHRFTTGVFAGSVERVVRLSGALIVVAGFGQLYVTFG